MDELEKLYAVLKRDGYYSKSFVEFVRQFENQDYRSKVFNVVRRDGLYSGQAQDFENKYYNPELIQKAIATDEEAAAYNQELEIAQQQYEQLKKEQLKRLRYEGILESIEEKRRNEMEGYMVSDRKPMPPPKAIEKEAQLIDQALSQFEVNYDVVSQRVPEDYAEKKYKSPQLLSLEIKDKGYDFETDDEYYNQFNTGDGSFIETHFGSEKLRAMGIDPKAFEGFMEQTGRKSDLQDKYSEGYYEERFYALSAAERAMDRPLQYDLDRNAALTDYFETLLTRKKERKSLEQQRDNGGKLVRPSANEKVNLGIDKNLYEDFIENEFQAYTQKLREQQEQQQEDYQRYKDGDLGQGLFSFRKVGKVIDDFERTIETSIYGFLGDVTGSDYLKSVAEAIGDEQFQANLFAPPTYSYSKAEGKKVNYNDQEYIVDRNGQVYNTNQKLIVTSLLDENDYKNIISESEKTQETEIDTSAVGGMIEFSAVLTDLLLQIGYTAATIVGPGKFTKALKVGKLGTGGQKIYNTLSKVPTLPVRKTVVNSVIAQAQIGYGRGYNDTYAAAKAAGLTDSKAKELANMAAQQTGTWYAITAPIATQGRAIDGLLGQKAKTTIGEAVKKFVKTGSKKDFADVMSGMAKGGKIFGITGMREAVQENVQEFGNVYKINKDVNELAGQKILRDTITMADVVHTTILSFLAGGLAGTIGASFSQSNRRQKSIFDLGTKNSSDKMNALGLLTNEYDKSVDVVNGMVANGTMAQSQADDLISMMESYRTSIGSMPQNTTPETAESILPKLSELRSLENKKENTDSVFHPAIDKKIQKLKEEISISVIYDQLPTAERLELKNQAENILNKELKPSEITDKAIYDKVIEILTPKIPKDAVQKQEAGDISITEPTPAIQEVEEEVRVTPEEEVEEEVTPQLYKLPETKSEWVKDFDIIDNRGGKADLEIEEDGKTGRWYVENNKTGRVVATKTKAEAQAEINNPTYDYGEGEPIITTTEEVETKIKDDEIASERKEMASARRKAAKVVPPPKRKKVTVDEAAALKDQIRLEARAARESKQNQSQKRKGIADKIRGFVRDGSITPKQASSIINRISKINLDNPKSVNNALAYAEKIMIDAENDKKLSDAQSIRKKIKKAAKGEKVDAIAAESAKNFALINPNTVEDIDLYLENAKKVLDGLRSSRIKGTGIAIKPMFNVDEINQYTSNALEREIEIENELFKQNFEDVTGLNADEFSVSEMRDILYAEDTTQEQIDSKANKRQELIRRAINNAFDRYSTVAKSMLKKGVDPFTGEAVEVSDEDKSRVNRFLRIDIDKLNNSEALKAIDSLVNFLTNLSTAGMDVVIGRDSGENAAQLLENKGFKARNVKSVGRLWNTWISSLPNFYQYIFTSPSQAREFDKQIGTRAYVDGAASAETETNKKIDDFIKKFRKTKPNRKSFNNIENITERGMGAFMMRSVDKDAQVEFDRRKKLIEESIVKLSESGKEVEVNKSKEYQVAYDKILKDSNSVQEVREKMNKTNLQAVEFVQDMWSEIYEDLSDVSLHVYNSVLGRDLNYTTDTFAKIEKVEDIEELGAAAYYDTRKRVYDEKTGVLKPTIRPTQLPKGRVVDLSFDSNNFSAYKRALIDINTAETTQRIIGFLNSDAFKKIVPSKDVRELVKDRVNLIVDAKRNVSKPYKDSYSGIVNSINQISKLGYARVLGGPFQFIKQLTPFVNTLINAGPQNTALAISLMTNRDVQNAINNSGKPIANRGLSSQSTITLDSRLRKAVESENILKLVGKTTGRVIVNFGEASLKLFLVAPDRFTARTSFLAYYIQELSKKGVDISGIDWSTHKIEGDAAAKAQFEVDRQQNISDADIQGELFSSKNPGAQMIRKIFFPFASFQMNQKTRAFNDLRTILSRTASSQDKLSAGRSLSALPAESVTFQGIGFILSAYLAALALGLIAYDEDDEEAYKRELNAIKGRFRNIATDIISPVPALDDTLIRFLNLFLDQEEKLFVGDKEDILRSLGTIGIPAAKATELIQISTIIDRGTIKRQFFGRETEKKLTDEAIDNLRVALVIKTLHNAGVLPPEFDYVAGVIVKKSKKMTEEEKKKSKPKKIKMSVLKELNPELYNEIRRSKKELKASSGNDILRQTAIQSTSIKPTNIKESKVEETVVK